MRVGAVTEGELLSALGEEGLLVGRSGSDGVSRSVLATEVVGDGRVVGSSVREGLQIRKSAQSASQSTMQRTLTAMRLLKSSETVPFPAFH